MRGWLGCIYCDKISNTVIKIKDIAHTFVEVSFTDK